LRAVDWPPGFDSSTPPGFAAAPVVSPGVVVQIEDLPLTFAILRNRDADAGAALTIDKIDSLRHRIGIFAAMVHGFEA
jgi:hypothetical protein